MSVTVQILDFCRGVYEETGVIPTRIVLPLAAHDRLKADCAKRIAQEPNVVVGTISCIHIETGHGIVEVLTSEPERATDAKGAAK